MNKYNKQSVLKKKYFRYRKQIKTLAQKKDCEIVGRWRKSITNHLYWTSLAAGGNAELAVAMWKSGANHIRNIHQHEDPLYPQCQHEPLPHDRETAWLQPGITICLYCMSQLSFN